MLIIENCGIQDTFQFENDFTCLFTKQRPQTPQMAAQYRLLIKNAKQLVTVCSNGEKMKIGKQMDEVKYCACRNYAFWIILLLPIYHC
jgi:hypothetical protein